MEKVEKFGEMAMHKTVLRDWERKGGVWKAECYIRVIRYCGGGAEKK